jgi:hypothetical protein
MPINSQNDSNVILICTLALATVGILSLLTLVILRYNNPVADVGIFVNICLTSLAYLAGIITGGSSNRKTRR